MPVPRRYPHAPPPPGGCRREIEARMKKRPEAQNECLFRPRTYPGHPGGPDFQVFCGAWVPHSPWLLSYSLWGSKSDINDTAFQMSQGNVPKSSAMPGPRGNGPWVKESAEFGRASPTRGSFLSFRPRGKRDRPGEAPRSYGSLLPAPAGPPPGRGHAGLHGASSPQRRTAQSEIQTPRLTEPNETGGRGWEPSQAKPSHG